MRRLAKHHSENPAVEPEQELEQTEQVEQPDTETTQTQAQAEPEKTETELLNEQIAALNDKLLRTVAEYDNFRKRSQREKEAIYPQATAAAVAKFVPILDTFDRAISVPCADEEFKKGVEMILNHFKETLHALGVEEFAEPGDLFNPEMHNAVMHVEDDTQGESVLVEVFQKGYKLGDRIVRHAMVKVAN